ncbi:MAG TPA: transposase [Pseudonocardiaceae bacterium]
MVYDDVVQLRYNFRVEPTPGQRIALARAFGCARVVFNDALRAREQAYRAGLPYITDTELMRRVITEAKQSSQRAWLGEVSAVVLQQAVADLNTAYRNFFASITCRRKGPGVARPRFRSRKDNRQASASPATPVSRSRQPPDCGCRRSGTCGSAGHGHSRPNRPRSR